MRTKLTNVKNKSKDRYSRSSRATKVLIPAVAVVAVLGVGGVAVASGVGSSDDLSGSTRDRAAEAALAEVGEGKVTDAETEDGGKYYEVEVTREDGTEVEVRLDKEFTVLDTEVDGPDDADDSDDSEDSDDADDRALTAEEAQQAGAAGLKAVPGAVTEIEASDRRIDGTQAGYQVEIVTENGTEWDVWLDDSFAVLGKEQDRTAGDDADPDDRVLGVAEAGRASAAGLEAVPGTVLGVEASDDRVDGSQAAYELDIVATDGAQWEVKLDQDFGVLVKQLD